MVKDGAYDVGSRSIYTASKFEGLALVVDTYGGSGGMIRGFLNDGTTDYKHQYNVDALSFGHCNFPYRNRGRPSQIKIRHSELNFRVDVDGRLCFESNKISLPMGYNIGITAASADNPDTFEVFKLAVLTDSNQQQQEDRGQNRGRQQEDQTKLAVGGTGTGAEKDLPEDRSGVETTDKSADQTTSSKAQFKDLQNDLHNVNHQISNVIHQISQLGIVGERRHEEASKVLAEVRTLLLKLDKLDSLENKILNLEREIRTIRSDIGQKVKDNENAIKTFVGDTHSHLAQKVADHGSPGHARLYMVIIGSQLLLLGGYVYYKTKKSSPKKYL
jgi:mannose-binding lectin 1